MRQLGGYLFVLAIGLASGTERAAMGQDKAPDYFPLKAGTKWAYELDQNGKKVKITSQIAKLEKMDGKSLALLETTINGEVAATEHLASTEAGVFRHRVNGIELSPPVCLLKYPLKKDDTWETEATIANEQLKIKGKVLDNEEVTVAAGKYKAFRVEVETSAAGMRATTIFWFAPDVGVVKQTTENAGKTVTAELEKSGSQASKQRTVRAKRPPATSSGWRRHRILPG